MIKLYPAIKLLCYWVLNLIKKAVPDNQDVFGNDGEKVEISSRLLQMSEFKFLQLAYSWWYGRDISEKNMESIFADYMLKNEVPHWARHFARQVLSQYSHRILDPHKYGIECIIPPHELNGTKVFITIFMIVVYFLFYLIFSGNISFQ
jgi:hypothetical protein